MGMCCDKRENFYPPCKTARGNRKNDQWLDFLSFKNTKGAVAAPSVRNFLTEPVVVILVVRVVVVEVNLAVVRVVVAVRDVVARESV